MSEGPGQPIRAYSAAQLEVIGCGHNATIRRRYFPEQGGFITADQFIIEVASNNKTRFIPFRLLTANDQAKVTAYKKQKNLTATLAELKKQHQEELQAAAEVPLSEEDRNDLWDRFGKKTNKQRDKAVNRIRGVQLYNEYVHGEGMMARDAVARIAQELGCSTSVIYIWKRKAACVGRHDIAAVLVNQRQGSNVAESEFTAEAIESFKKDWLRRCRPSISSCYRRLDVAAKLNGWIIPTKRTLENWIKRHLDPMVIKYRREGMEAVEKCFPAQERNPECFNVMEAVNSDGFQLGIWADFGNGVIAKPIVWSTQDIRSSKVLTYRIDISENRELVRLGLLDLITEWGLPHFYYLDNTRAATSKQISAGVPNRYRFKAKDDDPIGIIPLLGIELKYCLPGHGQSKPIERIHGIGGYLDFNTQPVFHGRGTKSKPVPIAELEEVFRSFVNEINARQDRQGHAVKGKSFDQVFSELYPEAIITKATENQRKYCMCVAEVVMVNKTDAGITLKAGQASFGQNRYWNDALTAYMGQKVTARFDPADMHSGIYVETLQGESICFAEATNKGGFKDSAAAKQQARDSGHFKKHVKAAAELEARMTANDARAQALTVADPEKPQAKATRIDNNIPSFREREPVEDIDRKYANVTRLPVKETEEEFNRRVDDKFAKALAVMGKR